MKAQATEGAFAP